MTKYEALLARLAPVPLRSGLLASGYPHVSHCAGTAKLLGEGLGSAICETGEIRSRQLHDDITSIACLIRAFIVLDDFVKDNALESTGNPSLFAWIDAIREETQERLNPLTSSADVLWRRYEQSYHDAYYNFQRTNVFGGVIRKCFPIFLPLHIDALGEDSRVAELEKALEVYLFCLQAMDDFNDMEEDAVAPQNHNVFLIEVSPGFHQGVMNRRAPLARALLPCVCRCVGEAKALLRSQFAMRHFDHSLGWLKAQQKAVGHQVATLHFHRNMREFRFRDEPEVRCLLAEPPESLPGTMALRAETMHTVVSTV